MFCIFNGRESESVRRIFVMAIVIDRAADDIPGACQKATGRRISVSQEALEQAFRVPRTDPSGGKGLDRLHEGAGPADYLLFLGNFLVGVIEAKRVGTHLDRCRNHSGDRSCSDPSRSRFGSIQNGPSPWRTS